VYGIVKGHQGFIDVRSQKGEGSTFLFYLPKTTGAMAEQDGSAEEVILGGRETVLFVDDERTIIEVMEETLETLGYRVLTADNGEEAIRLYREGKEEIDLVILDVIMPGMGGMETFEAMKAINNEVKVIFSSGYSVDHIAREIMDRGCRAFIQKPFNIETISRKVREVLQEV
jgi:DNA-binding NtrC family response regulator